MNRMVGSCATLAQDAPRTPRFRQATADLVKKGRGLYVMGTGAENEIASRGHHTRGQARQLAIGPQALRQIPTILHEGGRVSDHKVKALDRKSTRLNSS